MAKKDTAILPASQEEMENSEELFSDLTRTGVALSADCSEILSLN
jgi:hypothetical protein